MPYLSPIQQFHSNKWNSKHPLQPVAWPRRFFFYKDYKNKQMQNIKHVNIWKINQFTITDSQPDNILADKFSNFPLGDDRVVHVKSSILPLHRAVKVQCIAQPVVRRPATQKHMHLTVWLTSHFAEKQVISETILKESMLIWKRK